MTILKNKKQPKLPKTDTEAAAVWVHPSELVPWELNPRKNEKAVPKVAESIKKYGFASPIVARKSDNRVIAGHTRLKASILLGLEEVPVRFIEVTDEQATELTLADNKLGEIAEWDNEKLNTLIRDIPSIDLSDLGWSAIELVEMKTPPSPIKDVEPMMDRGEELRKKYKTELGQLWQLGDHRLMCGDSTNPKDVTRALDGLRVQIMVTDPPYGVEYDPTWRIEAGLTGDTGKMGKVLNDDRADWSEAWRLFTGDVAYVYHAGLMTALVAKSLEDSGFEMRSQIIWNKDRMVMSRGDYHWKHEPCWYAVRKGQPARRNDDRKQTTIWDIPARDDAGHGHGTQKPVECMARPIRNHNFENVYEPFNGSGTTIIACEQLGRKCRAIELSPAYVAIAIERWATATGKTPVNLNKASSK